MRQTNVRLTAMAAAFVLSLLPQGAAAQTVSIYQATLAEANQKTQEVSTEQVRRILADGSAILVDTRPRAEYAAGHIPSAQALVPYQPRLPNWNALSMATKGRPSCSTAMARIAARAGG